MVYDALLRMHGLGSAISAELLGIWNILTLVRDMDLLKVILELDF